MSDRRVRSKPSLRELSLKDVNQTKYESIKVENFAIDQ